MIEMQRSCAGRVWAAGALFALAATATVAAADGTSSAVAEVQARRALAFTAMEPGDLVVIHSGTQIPGPTGNLLADRDFLYLVGLAEEDMSLVLELDSDGVQHEVLFLPARNPRTEAWNGARLGPGKEATRVTGIADTRSTRELKGYLGEAAARALRVWHNHDRPKGEDPAIGITRVLLESFAGEPEVADARRTPGRLFRKLRQVKSPAEIETLSRSIEITCQALAKAMKRVEPGLAEYQVQALIEATFRWEGAEGLGFGSIIGSGKNGTVLHYVANADTIQDGELVLMDVGAEYHGYSADVTRTVPANGKFTDRQREIYEIVWRAQQAGFDAARPGSTIKQVHDAAWQVIADAGYARYFTHFTSHWLGLAVHDVGDFNAPLAPGMVLTVEPGIYLPEEGLGVRIEDDVLITEDGNRILSDGVPRTVDEIEALMAK